MVKHGNVEAGKQQLYPLALRVILVNFKISAITAAAAAAVLGLQWLNR